MNLFLVNLKRDWLLTLLVGVGIISTGVVSCYLYEFTIMVNEVVANAATVLGHAVADDTHNFMRCVEQVSSISQCIWR